MKSIYHLASARDKTLHIETEGGIVNIRVGLNDSEDRPVTSVEIIPDDHYADVIPWVLDGSRNNRIIKQTKPFNKEREATVKVCNMRSDRSGRGIANQFEIRDDEGNVYFQSYRTIIVKVSRDGKTYLDHNWDYSRTTGKYRNQFLGESKRETEAKIKSGEYIVTKLN